MDSSVTPSWHKSRHSDDKGGACVELAELGGRAAIRDSRDPDGPKILLTSAAFRALLTDLKQR